MGHVTYRDGIAILQLIAFIPSLICAIILCIRHGFGRSSGWVLLITFSLLRLVGAICELVAIDHASKGLIVAVLVCELIGLAPLTLVTWGVLSRLNNWIPKKIDTRLYKFVGIANIAGLSVGSYGATVATSDNDIHNPYSKAAICIFLAIWVIVTGAAILCGTQMEYVKQGERRILAAVAVCIPLIAIRLIYSFVGVFGNDSSFSIWDGSPTIYLCMAVLEEIVVIYILMAVGLTLKKLSPPGTSQETTEQLDEESFVPLGSRK